MIAVGHLVGYGAGTINLPNIFGNLLGDSQFKQLTVIAAATLAFAVGITSWAVEERVLVSAARFEALSKYCIGDLLLQRCGRQVWSIEDSEQNPQNDLASARSDTSYLLGSVLGLDR